MKFSENCFVFENEKAMSISQFINNKKERERNTKWKTYRGSSLGLNNHEQKLLLQGYKNKGRSLIWKFALFKYLKTAR